MQEFSTFDLVSQPNDFVRKNAPKQLYLEGDTTLLKEKLRVSVVGTRNPTEAGRRRARAFVEALVRHDIIVVSGLALGIDTIAHKTAIEKGGRTIAVLGTPLSQAYPAQNDTLLEKIKEEHLAISQFPEGFPSKRENFPQRNRTMALISDATVIVEASEKSGTRSQGWETLRLGRLLFLMESVADNPKLNWPKEMIQYGAQVLTRDNLEDVLTEIPAYTSAGDEIGF